MSDGDRNSGDNNSGDNNSGDNNSGYNNSGYSNSGYSNSGNRNSGDRNSGDYNSGDNNSGDNNSGYNNSGYRNSGDRNSGDYNSGNRNSGYFCTETPAPMMFDQPCLMTWDELDELIPFIDLPCGVEWISETQMSEQEKSEFPNYAVLGGYLKSQPIPIDEAFPQAWAKMSESEKAAWTSLPNFDAEKFLTITGVDVWLEKKAENQVEEMADEKTYDTIVIDGKTYRLVPE